ncbi:unnamed protein product [Paramecium sonneborni]|uniref:Uncharacterized protein n=1 Tax=Paramecium sonneborni TaxID=65129 RepID=A0A8S1RUR6_9CILI|nr:unnamed protein product [Paramecium sonneborni]
MMLNIFENYFITQNMTFVEKMEKLRYNKFEMCCQIYFNQKEKSSFSYIQLEQVI